MSKRTVSDLEQMLRERDLCAQIFTTAFGTGGFVVWLHATDDPELGVFPGEGETLDDALGAAFDAWDQKRPS